LKYTVSVIVVWFIALIFMNCTSKSLTVLDVNAEPQPASRGEMITLQVEIDGPIKNVDYVQMTVREFPEMVSRLRNAGQGGDETADDNIWSMATEVPSDAPPGTYHVDLSVFDINGNELVSEELTNQWTGKSATISLKIQN